MSAPAIPHDGEGGLEVQVDDLSATGFTMHGGEELRPGQTIWISLGGAISQARITGRTSVGCGCQLTRPLRPCELAAAMRDTSVAATPWVSVGTEGEDEPRVARWPLPARAAFIIGSSAVLWALIIRLLL